MTLLTPVCICGLFSVAKLGKTPGSLPATPISSIPLFNVSVCVDGTFILYFVVLMFTVRLISMHVLQCV